MNAAIPLLWMWMSLALGQGFDGHGASAGPAGADSLAPVTVTDAVAPDGGGWSARGMLDVAGQPLVAIEEDGSEFIRSCVLCTVGALELSAAYGLSDRFALAISAPAFVATTSTETVLAVGDAQLWVPVALWRGPKASLGLWPFVSLPTGASDLFLGDGVIGGGGRVAASIRNQHVSANVDLGLQSHGSGVTRALMLRTGAAVAVHPMDALALGVEARRAGRLTADGAGSPLEVLGSVRARATPLLALRAGAGAGITDAPGSASWRMFAGVSVTRPPAARPAGADASALGDVVIVEVVDTDGRAVRGAVVRLKGEAVGTTDHTGRVKLPRRMRWELGPVVEANAMVTSELGAPPADGHEMRLVLPWAPIPLRLRVVDDRGQLLDADVRFEGAATLDAPSSDELGTVTYLVPAGIWSLHLTAPGFSPQQRTLVVPPRRTDPMRIDAIMSRSHDGAAHMWLTVTDPDGDPVEGALVMMGGAPLGTTGTGGDLKVSQLTEGTTEVVVSEGRFEIPRPMTVELTAEGAQPVIMLTHLPGSVEVKVRGPDGQPADAVVALRSRTMSIEPVQIGVDGRHIWVLSEGAWTLLVSSPSLGLQERTFVVDHAQRSLRVVEVDLLPQAGEARLELVVADATGRPVADVAVSLGGQTVGRTGTDGSMRIDGLAIGEVELRLEGERMLPWVRTVRFGPGIRRVDAIVDWQPGTIRVQAVGQDGRPVRGQVRATDGDSVVRQDLDLDGLWVETLPAGEWEVLVSAADLGLQTRQVTVRPEETVLLTVDFRLAEVAGDGVLSVDLHDPNGEPVRGASLWIDGDLVGTTGSGGALRVEGLARGPHVVEVQAEGHETVDVEFALGAKPHVATLELPWAAGLLELVLRDGDRALTEAVVRIAGERTLPAMGPDAEGMLRVPLAPGDWTVFVSSVHAGLAERALTLPPRADGPMRVEIVLQTQGTSSLLVRIRDEDGLPVSGVRIALADVETTTSAGGGALLTGLHPGPASVSVTPPPPLRPQTLEFEVPTGSDELAIDVKWPRSTATFIVLDDRGIPVQADLLLQGPGVIPIQSTNHDGHATTDLRPGTWAVFGRSEGLEGNSPFEVVVGAPAEVSVTLAPVAEAFRGFRLSLDEAVLFDVGASELRDGSASMVDELAEHLLSSPNIVLAEVQGHTDSRGSFALNLRLSHERANTVLQALVARGVPGERLRARGYAMLRPVALGDTEASHSQNRRVEIVVVEHAVDQQAVLR